MLPPWLQVHFKFELMQETLYLMVTLFDRYLSLVPIKKNDMQLVGLTALLLASKYEDFWHPRVANYLFNPYSLYLNLTGSFQALCSLHFHVSSGTG